LAGKFRGVYQFAMVTDIDVTNGGVGITMGMCVVDGEVERKV